MKTILLNTLAGAAIAIPVGFLIWFLGLTLWAIGVSAECKSLGYRTATIGFPSTAYCESRIEQTDRIIPLDFAKKHPLPL